VTLRWPSSHAIVSGSMVCRMRFGVRSAVMLKMEDAGVTESAGRG
jgi:hypothetical protein